MLSVSVWATHWWCPTCWCPRGPLRTWWWLRQCSLSDSHSLLFWSRWMDTGWGRWAWETHTHAKDTLASIGIYSFTEEEKKTELGVSWLCNETGSYCYPFGCLPETKDLWKILPFTGCQGDVLLWSLCLHSCTVDLRKKGEGGVRGKVELGDEIKEKWWSRDKGKTERWKRKVKKNYLSAEDVPIRKWKYLMGHNCFGGTRAA